MKHNPNQGKAKQRDITDKLAAVPMPLPPPFQHQIVFKKKNQVKENNKEKDPAASS